MEIDDTDPSAPNRGGVQSSGHATNSSDRTAPETRKTELKFPRRISNSTMLTVKIMCSKLGPINILQKKNLKLERILFTVLLFFVSFPTK